MTQNPAVVSGGPGGDPGRGGPQGLGFLWTIETSGTAAALHDIWGSAASDVYAVGESGTILHSIGDGRWTPTGDGSSSIWFHVWGSAGDDVHVVGETADWQAQRWSRSADHGVTWNAQAFGMGGEPSLWGTSRTDFYVGAGHTMDGGRSFSPIPGGTYAGFRWVWSFGAEVFTCSSRQVSSSNGPGTPLQIYHSLDGFQTRPWDVWQYGSSEAGPPMTGIWGTSAQNVYFTFHGVDQALHWDGQQLTLISFPQAWAIWGSGPDDIWVVGGPSITHSDHLGTTSLLATTGTSDLHAVWGSGPDDIYAVGDQGTILHGRR